MATILFSSAIYTGPGNQGLVSGSAGTIHATSIYGSNGSGGAGNTLLAMATVNNACPGLLNIYKGTKATFSTFTNTTQRTSDLLISFTSTGMRYNEPASTNSRRMQSLYFDSLIVNATQSGVASWFLYANQFASGSLTDLTNRGAFIGSIGSIGSSGDLQIVNTNIVSGTGYRSNGLYLNWPFSWTV